MGLLAPLPTKTWGPPPRGTVAVWYVRTADVSDAGTLDAIRGVLTDEERTKHQRFVFEKNRHEYLVTRGIERAVLSRCLGRPARHLEFRRNDYGRPEVVPETELRFNLTNTVAMVACAVATGREVGVDAEPLDRADTILEIAETVFTEHEREALSRLALDARRRRAVELWTLKEAYMKARGMGMSLPVQQFEMRFDGPAPPALGLHEQIVDDVSRWWFATRQIDDHLVSLCVERRGDDVPGPTPITIDKADLAALRH